MKVAFIKIHQMSHRTTAFYTKYRLLHLDPCKSKAIQSDCTVKTHLSNNKAMQISQLSAYNIYIYIFYKTKPTPTKQTLSDPCESITRKPLKPNNHSKIHHNSHNNNEHFRSHPLQN